MMHSVGLSVNRCPSYISQLVQPVNNSSRRQALRSPSSAKYVVQRKRTIRKFAKSAFSVAGPSEWNSLSADIRLESDTAVYKGKLKNCLFVLFSLVIFPFLARDSIYAIAHSLLSPVRLSVCPSVCLSLCPSHGWISQRRFKIGSRNLHHSVAP